MTLFLYINGIKAQPERVHDWQDRAVRWTAANVPASIADAYEYKARPLTRWMKQGQRVKSVFDLIRDYRDRIPGLEIVVAGHSNGGDIAVRLVREHPGLRIRELHLIAAATDPDFQRNRLNDVLLSGYLDRVVCYVSRDDSALGTPASLSRFFGGWAGLGYGDLGRVGPENVDPRVQERVAIIPRHTFDHSTWFDGDGPGSFFDATMSSITGVSP